MIIIAFSKKTSKFLPRIICRNFKHCAPIIVTNGTMYMLQFTSPKRIYKIPMDNRAIRTLGAHGWKFVYVPRSLPADFCACAAFSCVDLSKRALRLHAPRIQTPDSLYRYLNQ